ncbi:MAG TPA: septum site-determining protein MinC [Candidatus Limnocylindrales bacterium]|nr:septum site-determining protein MinC [Candidatus Limnocylindrales bacterium]
MPDTTIAIKGVNDGLLIALDEAEEWLTITQSLAARLDEQPAFFSGARVVLDVGARPVRKDEMGSIKALFDRRNMLLIRVASASDTTLDAASALDLRATAKDSAAEAAPGLDTLPFNPNEDGTPGVMVKHTVRSGRRVYSAGHVVIMGDVNPGAEIVAVGDVVVWGRLRGNVQAGSEGDASAVVCALDMMPTQLRIGSLIAVSPVDKRHKPKAEIALIRDGRIVVEEWR